MTRSWSHWYKKLALASALAMGGAITLTGCFAISWAGALWAIPFGIASLHASLGDCALAQIIPDTTLGNENSTVTSTGSVDQIDGGATRGTNLFHSFQEFNIGNGRSAFFSNPPGIENILSRVTGANPSNILGTLGVSGGNANLFLINPNGIIFGRNARLDVGGSFVATTANAIAFPGGGEFSLTSSVDPQNSLLSVNPSAFLFNQIAAQPTNSIEVRGNLAVPENRSLLLVGGNVAPNAASSGGILIDRGTLRAPGGRVELSGVAGTGTVELNVDGNNLSLSPLEGVARTDITLANRSIVNVVAGGGGSIAINAQNLNILERSFLFAAIGEGLGSVDSQVGDITLNATDAITVGQLSTILNGIGPGATGTGGNINITTGSLFVTDGAELVATTFGQGNAGSVNIQARDTVSFDGVGSDGSNSRALSTVNERAEGNGGSINIITGSLSVTNGAILSASTYGQGDAGNVNIQARDTVSFDGVGSDGFYSAAFSTVESGAVGNGGSINITTESLAVTDGALLSASTAGQGNAGNVNIHARDTVSFDQESTISSRVESGAAGNGGSINITTGSLSVTDGVHLVANTRGQGNAGSVTLHARDTISFDGESTTAFSTVEPGAEGNGGSINIITGSLSLTNGAQLLANTRGQGHAGSVNISADSTVSFDGVGSNGLPSAASSVVEFRDAVGNGGSVNITTGSLSVRNGALLGAGTRGQGNAGNVNIHARDIVSFDGESTTVFSRVESEVVGKGGSINITTGSLSVTNGALLTASTLGQGNAGNVNIHAQDNVSFDGESAALSAVEPGAEGNGGSINITTGSLVVTDGAQLSAFTRGQGNAGSVNISAASTVSFDGVSSNGASSAAFSAVTEGAVGNGGSIDITTGSLSVTNGAQVNVSSEGTGNAGNLEVTSSDLVLDNRGVLRATTLSGEGGNITVRSHDLILMRRNSEISTEAGGTGNGGNIKLDADFIVAIPSEDSDIVADAFEGNGGNIRITTQGIYGLEYRDRRTPKSDITASSDFGVDGVVEINTPDVDPSQGLATLPAEPVNPEVAQTCTAGGAQAQSSFIITGRGGLPPNPKEAVSSDDVVVNWVPLNSEGENFSTPTVSTKATSATPAPLVEAQGWVMNDLGQVVLTASASSVTPHSPWQTPNSCGTPQSEARSGA